MDEVVRALIPRGVEVVGSMVESSHGEYYADQNTVMG